MTASKLTPAMSSALRLLSDFGDAYRVRVGWELRGWGGHIAPGTMDALEKRGLVREVHFSRRITKAGREACPASTPGDRS